MNKEVKEVIKANKEAFDWWLDGGEVLCKYNDSPTWLMVDNTWHWDEDCLSYAINDEYVEFRKALAEGRIIQQATFSNGCLEPTGWVDRDTCAFTYPVDRYRIKPDEPKFKEGDWVIVKALDGVGKTEFLAKMVTDTRWNVPSNQWCNSLSCSGEVKDIIKLWEPKEGDVVVVWNNGEFYREVSIVTSDKCIEVSSGLQDIDSYDNIIPHIGQPFEDMA